MFPNLYILPGLTRDADRVVPAADVKIVPLASRVGSPPSIEVQFRDGTRRAYPFVAPCLHRPQWTNLESFQDYVLRKVQLGSPYKSNERLPLSVSAGYVAFADGSVYERESISREIEMLRKLPCVATVCKPEGFCSEDIYVEEDDYCAVVDAPV